ncbi:MAG: hypothetical protein Q4C55_06690 [Eubacterium sp.]|nr:hypothetical protein [Eubacterium sp.]
MKASSLLDTVVVLDKDGRWRGKVCDIRIRDQAVDAFVLSEGGLFSRAQIFTPEAIVSAAYDHIALTSEAAIQKMSPRALKARLRGSHSVTGVRVKDVDGEDFASTADAVLDEDYRVVEYELSRSFFDDLDRGYGIVAAADLRLDASGALVYARDMLDIARTGREGGAIAKILGEEAGR